MYVHYYYLNLQWCVIVRVGWGISEFYHKEGVTNPQTSPALRAGRYVEILAVDSDCLGWSLTHWAAANVLRYLLTCHRHHGNGRRGGQPIGFVIPASVAADFIDCAVQEGDGAEIWQTWAGQSCEEIWIQLSFRVSGKSTHQFIHVKLSILPSAQ